jgi:transcriptional regulator with XRE-family HTH domain
MATRPNFGIKIKQLRTEKKMTLDELASATKSSKSYIWELENKNPPRPSAEKLATIARALGVTVDYLLGNEQQTKKNAEDMAFFREYSNLPDDTRLQLREMAKILTKKNTQK